MAITQKDLTAGTNAAIPAATAFINEFVPGFYQDQVDPKIPQLVAIIVAAAIPAVDAERAANQPPNTRKTTMLAGWRTLLIGVAIAVAGVLQTFNWATVVPQDQTWSGMLMLAIGGGIVFLRYITTTPIGVAPSSTKG